jgi:hypothetical protein
MILDLPLILETRRNHALEHATLHVLARKYPRQSMGGHSNPTGFLLYGKLDIQDIWTSATEAMARLRAGESNLAVHPGCGTNLVTSSVLAGTLGWLPLRRAKSTFWRIWLIPTAIVFAIFGYFLSRPAGPWLQANVTTEANLGEMKIVDIVRLSDVVHRVITK